ncbi:hypothetical protein [Paenibacillus sp. 1_12]|nr:hypothetical protein [Paenibacillus sp. 1_12]
MNNNKQTAIADGHSQGTVCLLDPNRYELALEIEACIVFKDD